jgi:NADH-quinone oxidoreductase subunit E
MNKPVLQDAPATQLVPGSQGAPVLQDPLDEILSRHPREKSSLISILQETQEVFGFLSKGNLKRIAGALKVSEAMVFGVATFYAQFHLTPRGKHIVRVCLGTACHVRGGEKILQAVSENLGVQPGGTTEDMVFTLERVACLGACGLAPCMMIDDKTYGRLNENEVSDILDGIRSARAEA